MTLLQMLEKQENAETNCLDSKCRGYRHDYPSQSSSPVRGPKEYTKEKLMEIECWCVRELT